MSWSAKQSVIQCNGWGSNTCYPRYSSRLYDAPSWQPSCCCTSSFNGSSGGMWQHSHKLTDTFKWFDGIQIRTFITSANKIQENEVWSDPTLKSYVHMKWMRCKACGEKSIFKCSKCIHTVALCNSNMCLDWHWSKILMGNASLIDGWKHVLKCEIDSNRRWVMAWLWLRNNSVLTLLHAHTHYHNCSIL